MEGGCVTSHQPTQSVYEESADYVRRVLGAAEERWVSFGPGRMIWRIWGDGPPLVLLHGAFGSWDHWIRNVLVLGERFTVIAADIPGHGDSDALPGRPTRDELSVAIARGLAGIVGPRTPYDLVGFSMGANLSAAAAAAHGGVLRRLVLVGPGGLGVPSKKIAGLRRWRPDMPRHELDSCHRNNLGLIMFHDPARIDDLAVHLQRENGLRLRFHLDRSGVNTYLRDCLSKVRAEVRCVWGDHDVYALGNRDRRIAVLRQTHPDLDLRIVPDAAHWVMYEQAEAFNAAMFELLAR